MRTDFVTVLHIVDMDVIGSALMMQVAFGRFIVSAEPGVGCQDGLSEGQ